MLWIHSIPNVVLMPGSWTRGSTTHFRLLRKTSCGVSRPSVGSYAFCFWNSRTAPYSLTLLRQGRDGKEANTVSKWKLSVEEF